MEELVTAELKQENNIWLFHNFSYPPNNSNLVGELNIASKARKNLDSKSR